MIETQPPCGHTGGWIPVSRFGAKGDDAFMEYELRNFSVKKGEFRRIMDFSEKYLFSLGLGDAAEEVGKENAKLFIATMHSIQEALGYDRRAIVVGAPNFTFQTSPEKFRQGIPEGARFAWGDGRYDFIPADLSFDFCGMLVGGVYDEPSLKDVLDTIHEMSEKEYEIDGMKVDKRRFRPGGHFLKLYEVENRDLPDPPRVAVLHTSSDEMYRLLRGFVDERCEEVKTPFGVRRILLDSDAREYRRRCEYASKFSMEKRKLLFEEVFGGEVMANRNHYDLVGLNEAVIGCDIVDEGEVSIVSLPDRAYLVKGRRNLSPEKIKECPNLTSAEKWVYEYLLNLNIVPHGSGHKLLGVDKLVKVIFYPKGRVFLFRRDSRLEVYEDLWDAPRWFRGEGMLERILSLGLADYYAHLKLLYTVKVDF